MTAILTQTTAAALDNFGYAQLPSLSKALGYYLLRGATPLANLIPGGQPLTAIGGGPLAYEADCVLLQGAGALVTAETTTDANRSAILVFSDAYRDMATPASPTAAIGTYTGDSRYLTWGNATVYQRGGNLFFNTDQGGAAQLFGNGYRTLDLPVYFPDGAIRRGRFAVLGITTDGTTARLYQQNGGIVEVVTMPAAIAAGGTAYPMTIGTGDGATTRWRCAAAAQFTAFASDAEMFANMAFIAPDVEASGTIDFSPFGLGLAT